MKRSGRAGWWWRDRDIDDGFLTGFDNDVLECIAANDREVAVVFVFVKLGDVGLVQGETIGARGQLHRVTTIALAANASDLPRDLIRNYNDNTAGWCSGGSTDHALELARRLAQGQKTTHRDQQPRNCDLE